ncbi:PilZ domain-containing protein [Thalassotalea atypica]|uniref:PilZ domain-containing protein n=1 Tax=Thalassotalea atypica TaxID=2054316 RepID=UPI00257369FA|nr:PilZ domain-containing protein [Thalassotalea atypica]
MTTAENTTKLEQFNEFFSIEHKFSVNLVAIDTNRLPSFEHFLSKMPLPFRISSDIVALDQAALRPIQALSGVAGQLVEFLNHQANKIDLLVGYILSQQDEPEHRYRGIKFGGGGVIFESDCAFNIGQMLEMKVFLLEENCAVFCVGEVIELEAMPQSSDSDSNNKNECHQHKVIFHYLREEDREVLVRTSLHLQSKQLQDLSKQRNQANQ